jgi:CubicO group peptidase (beta-lactamase class C family)
MEEVIKDNNGETTREKQRMVSNQDVLNTLISARPPAHAAPNTRFEYCNTNYVLLALLIEKISGMSFPVYMKKYFFDRLSMHNTFVYQPQDSLRSTPSYQPNGARWSLDYLDQTYGDKNIYSTPQDLLKWDQALYTDQLIDTSLLQQAFSGYSFERAGTHNYGLGFRLSLLPNGKKIVYHFGRWHGNNAAFTRLLNEKVVIIIIGNRFNRSIYSAAHNSYDLFGSYFKRDAEEEDP